MKKNVKTLAVAGLVIGALAIGGIGTVAMASGNAYQTYKDAALSVTHRENHTMDTSFSAKENDVILFSGTSQTKIDGADTYSSARVEGGGQAVDTESSTVGGTVTRRTGEVYTSTALDSRYQEWERPGATSTSTKLMSMVTDLLVGDVKTHFTSSGETVSVNLSGAQIPELMNVAVSAMLEQSGNHADRFDTNGDYTDMLRNLPIKKAAVIQSVKLDATVSGGEITGQDLVIVLTGDDAVGTSHEVELTVKMATSEIGSTTVQAIDTTGKNVTESNMNYMR